jgi:hypothetical protein
MHDRVEKKIMALHIGRFKVDGHKKWCGKLA